MIQQPLDFGHQVQTTHVGGSEKWRASGLETGGVPKVINSYSKLEKVFHHANAAIMVSMEKSITQRHTAFDLSSMLDQDINNLHTGLGYCELQRSL